MQLELLKQAAAPLSACGAVVPFRGGLAVPFPLKRFLVPLSVQGNTATFSLEITGESTWEFGAISSDQGMAVV